MQIFLGVLGKGGGAQTRCILGAVQVANKRVPKDNDNSERLDYKSLEPLSHASKLLFVRFVNTIVNHEHSVSNCHFAVEADMLVDKDESISLCGELDSFFLQNLAKRCVF